MGDKDLLEIDQELIRSMRAKGLTYEADELLRQYHLINKKNLKQAKKKNIAIRAKIRLFKMKVLKICNRCSTPHDEKGVRCVDCMVKHRQYSK